MTPKEASTNQLALDEIERAGGAYIWDAEVFAVTFMDNPVKEEDASFLLRLVGVQQIALNPRVLGWHTLKRIACIPGLQSLVLLDSWLSESEITTLRQHVSEVVEVKK